MSAPNPLSVLLQEPGDAVLDELRCTGPIVELRAPLPPAVPPEPQDEPEAVELGYCFDGQIFVNASGEQLHEDHLPDVEGRHVAFAYEVAPAHLQAAREASEEIQGWLLECGATSVTFVEILAGALPDE